MSNQIEENVKLFPEYIRPQQLESRPLSGDTVTVKSRSGTGLAFRGKQYKPDKKDGLIRKVPIEAIKQIEDATYWNNGKASVVRFEIVEDEK
jgi:hypothetical protein